jgi:hypothetical protein
MMAQMKVPIDSPIGDVLVVFDGDANCAPESLGTRIV